MSAKHAVLGFFAARPAYPYQLENLLKERLGPAWKINSGQIYQTTKWLKQEGFIERIDGSDGDPDDDRHIFAITERGMEEFERWRHAPTDRTRPLRRPVLIKLMFSGPEYREQTLRDIDAYELACSQRLKKLLREQGEIPPDGSRVRADHVILRLALNLEVGHWEAELDWSRDTRETLKSLYNKDNVIWPSSPGKRSATTPDSQNARDELFGRIAKRSPPTPARQQQKRGS
jgi:DNA-binding PadR family transcriptional regulator